MKLEVLHVGAIPQQKQWQFPNVFRLICTLHVYKLHQCTNKLLVCKLANCLFATTTVSICVKCLHTRYL